MYSVCAILSSRATRDHHQLFHKVNTMLYGATSEDSSFLGMTKFEDNWDEKTSMDVSNKE